MIENLNFRFLDIDKYIDFLKSKYATVLEIKYLPMFESMYNEYLILSYQRHSRLILKGYQCDSKDQRLSPSERTHFEYLTKHIEKLKVAVYEVVILDWYRRQNFTNSDLNKKYFIFDKKDLENFEFDLGNISYLLTDFINNSFNDFVIEVENDFYSSPLPQKEYYTNRIKEIKNIADFQILDLFIGGKIIHGLDDSSKCMGVAMEFIYIKQIKYLEESIYNLENENTHSIKDIEKTKLTKGLTQKQTAWLFQCLSEIGVFAKNKVSQDAINQAKLIAICTGLNIPEDYKKWNFYTYWNNTQKRIDKKDNSIKRDLNLLLDLSRSIGFNALCDNISDKLNDMS